MVTVTTRKVNAGSPKIIGIVAAARALGVTRQHLYLVIKGERKSPRLLASYNAWKKRNATKRT